MGELSLPVSAMVWLRPHAAETITWSARASINLGASRRLVSPWPSWPLSLRPAEARKQKPACKSTVIRAAFTGVTSVCGWRRLRIYSVTNICSWTQHVTHPSSTACPRWSWGDCVRRRDRRPRSSPGHHSDSRSDVDPRDSGPSYGKQLETSRQHIRTWWSPCQSIHPVSTKFYLRILNVFKYLR